VNISDKIVEILDNNNIERCFMVTGGGSMHLNEAFRKSSNIKILPMHHEQACAMAADSYARLNHKPAVVNVTTGPGVVNSLNGVFSAFTDSLPMVIISGQVKSETYSKFTIPEIRQLGDQEVKTEDLVKPIVKKVITLKDGENIEKILQELINLSISGRPGPVWLDVPIDVQGKEFLDQSTKTEQMKNSDIEHVSKDQLDKLNQLIKESKRPVILAGSGIRISNSYAEFIDLVEHLNIPITTAFNAHDLINTDHRLYVGRPGTVGDRSGNFAVQNSDLLIVLGCRLNIRQIGYEYKTFAREAKIVMVDIDEYELKKPTLDIHLPIQADLNDFLKVAKENLEKYNNKNYLEWAKKNLEDLPVVLPEYALSDDVNPYLLLNSFSKKLSDDDIVVTSDGSAVVMTFQSFFVRQGQRLYSNSGSASMGYGLPASIGAGIDSAKNIYCIEGDGSIMMNLQELQTIVANKLNIKVLLIENGGYLSIKQTQQNFYDGNFIGCDEESGLPFPDFKNIFEAFGFSVLHLNKTKNIDRKLDEFINAKEHCVLIASVDRAQTFSPKVSSKRNKSGVIRSAPLEDMFPFLDRSEFSSRMIIDEINLDD